jgi:tetratricopeptide (TPR) repeat protein
MHKESALHILRQAEDALRDRRYDHALTILGVGFASQIGYRPFYTLAARVLEHMDARREARLFWQALANFEDWEPFFRIGFYFVDAWQYDMATPFMERAHQVAPENADVAHELALCYANTFRVAEALTMLEAFERHDFWTSYRMHRYRLLLGETAGLEDYLAKASGALSRQQGQHEGVSQGYALLEELREMWHRCRAAGGEAGPWELRRWHFIQYGSVLLEQMGEERRRELATAMQVDAGGRFIRYFGGMGQVSALLHRLVRQLAISGKEHRKIVYLENRDDAILALALSRLTGLPAEPADGENLSHAHTLVVAADNRTYNGEHELCEVQPHQTVFAFQIDWMQPAMMCPDIAGVLTLQYAFPWRRKPQGESFMSLASQAYGDPEDLHERTAEEVADLLAQTPPAPLESPPVEACRVALGQAALALRHRPVFRVESPVRKQGAISPFMM